jgi:UDP-N-acetylmuramoyl-L-alanyl-D-glutamate--2,6-diaminopimelate ligase
MTVDRRAAGTGLPLPSPAHAAVGWLRARLAPGAAVAADSRALRAGDAFLAHPGERGDGRDHIGRAIAAGAAAIVHERAGFEPEPAAAAAVPHLALDGLRALVGPIASAWWGDPSGALRVVAVTGTNGKTSCTHWLAQLLREAGRPCGVVGTLGPWGLTTPDAATLQRVFAGFVAQGLSGAAIEASSIGLHQQRLAGTRIRTAVFTNLTRDHLDYHGDMAAYAQAKALLFGWPMLESAVVNADDEWTPLMLSRLAPGTRRIGFTLGAPRADGSGAGSSIDAWLRATRVAPLAAGTALEIDGDFGRIELELSAIGRHNAQNALAVLGAALAEGVPIDAAAAALARLAPVPGRLQTVALAGAPLAVVDYAHTPDALANALAALRPVAQARGGRLWCVFGAGGDRDPGKRPLMGEVAERLADAVVLTSDNPRGESPAAILAQIAAGMRAPATAIEPDRAAAIALAADRAAPADVVLIAGKGHEDYQEIAGRRLPFSDVERRAPRSARRDTGSRRRCSAW